MILRLSDIKLDLEADYFNINILKHVVNSLWNIEVSTLLCSNVVNSKLALLLHHYHLGDMVNLVLL